MVGTPTILAFSRFSSATPTDKFRCINVQWAKNAKFDTQVPRFRNILLTLYPRQKLFVRNTGIVAYFGV
jgi:hypothetical protein